MLFYILISIGSIIAIILIIAALVKKDYSISSEIVINASKEKVFNYIKCLKNQEKYSKWVMADPNAKLEYKGTDGTVGFIASWNSGMKNVGIGEQEIKKITEGEGYDVEIRFKKPFEGTSQANTKAVALSATQTKFTTTFYSRTPFPMSIMIPMLKKMLVKDMDENSANLKRILESD